MVSAFSCQLAITRLYILLVLAIGGLTVFGQEPEAKSPEFDFGRGIYNAAKDKPAVASSASNNDPSTNATDGDSKTLWMPNDAEFPHWLRINVRRELSAKAIVLQWDTDKPMQYQIESSTDGLEWKNAIDATGNDKGALVVRHNVSTQKTQYFRITITGSDDPKALGLREIAIYENPDNIPKLLQDAAKGILPKPKPEPKPEPESKVTPKPEPAPEPEKMTKTDPVPMTEPKPVPVPDENKPSQPQTAPSGTMVATELIRPATDDLLLRTLRIPKDYTATIFARPPQVTYPTAVKTTLEGAVYVSSDQNSALGRESNRGKVQKLIDKDGDGVADEFHDFIPDLDSPRGLEWDGEWLYVVHPPHLSAFRDTDGDHVADENRQLVSNIGFGFDDRPMDQNANGIKLGIDGWLYVAIGDYGVFNALGADKTSLTQRGSCVVRVRPDGSGLHVFSRGLHSIADIAISPGSEVFARDNPIEGGKWGVRFHHLTGLLDHGFPSLFLNFPEDMVPPLSEIPTGSGNGAVWLAGLNQPATADCEKGMIYRHEIEPQGATFVEKAQHEFVAVPSPIAIDSDDSGRLYAASWLGGSIKPDGENVGFIAQISPANTKPAKAPDFKKADISELIALLKSEQNSVRLQAQRELLRRENIDVAAVKKAFFDQTGSDRRSNPVRSYAALFALAQINTTAAFDALIEIAKSSQMPTRAACYRALGDRDKATDHEVFKILPEVTDPVLVREILIAMTRTNTRDTPLAQGILKQTRHKDSLVALTAVESLVELNAQRSCLAVLDEAERASEWPGAMRALGRMHSMTVVYGLTEKLKTTDFAVKRVCGVKALARLYNREGTWGGESWGPRPDTSGPYFSSETWGGSGTIANYLKTVEKDSRFSQTVLLHEMGRNRIKIDNLHSILTLLIDKPELETSAINLILERSEPPPEALPFLTYIASDPGHEGEMRIRAALGLAKSKDAMALDMALETAASADEIDAPYRAKEKLHKSLLTNATLQNRYSALIDHGFSPNPPLAKYAWEILVNWKDNDKSAPSMRAEIEDAMDRARKNPDVVDHLPAR